VIFAIVVTLFFLGTLGVLIALCQIARVNQVMQALSDRIWR
jgi:hypothetical protein